MQTRVIELAARLIEHALRGDWSYVSYLATVTAHAAKEQNKPST